MSFQQTLQKETDTGSKKANEKIETCKQEAGIVDVESRLPSEKVSPTSEYEHFLLSAASVLYQLFAFQDGRFTALKFETIAGDNQWKGSGSAFLRQDAKSITAKGDEDDVQVAVDQKEKRKGKGKGREKLYLLVCKGCRWGAKLTTMLTTCRIYRKDT